MARMATGALIALMMAGAAHAQQPGAPYPPPPPGGPGGPGMGHPSPPPPQAGDRWDEHADGGWQGGAPGGRAAHRRLRHGDRLSGYWTQPRFRIDDWAAYGFAPPPPGYYWSRYYDDAVLTDEHGDVSDWRDGVDWNRRGGYREDRRYPMGGPGYPPPPGPTTWVSPDGATTVTVTTAGAAPIVAAPPVVYGYGYGYAAGATTTVTVQTAPVVTTTTTEIVDDRVYTPRRVIRHRVTCGCRPAPRPHHRPPPRVIGS